VGEFNQVRDRILPVRAAISIPVVRGGVQRQAFILPDLSGFQSLISRIANKPKTNTTQ
jgi:hypothetical protein